SADWLHFFAAWESLHLPSLMLALFFYIMTNIVRAYRFQLLFWQHPKHIPAIKLIPDMFLLSFLNNTLPARTGELSFPLMIKRRHGVAVTLGFFALFWARVADFSAVVLLLGLSIA
ncbi:MAG: hypothetical protein F6K62_24665, partial [Sphaerospermopsis sp. SIO1G2]|nr:hypothetical protein [Sphaerospermopsis sp. SIO1G2]